VTDPWMRFARAAAGEDVAGYFEQASRRGRPGRALWFTRADELRTIDRRATPRAEAAAAERFLAARPRRAVVGFLGFDAVGLFEPCLRSFPSGNPFPLGVFAWVDRPHRAPVRSRPRLRTPATVTPGQPRHDTLPRARYERSVRRLVEEIRRGEAYQVVLAHRREWDRPADLPARAERLRASERYAYFYYLRFGDIEIVGATPESVAEVRGSKAWLNPIAGTVPLGPRGRGRMPLRVDPKELSEHRMLVDLARNDLGSVAKTGSVRLLAREKVERFARLDHLVTRVGAVLRPGIGPWDVLGAAFPAGTVSGAPKIRATELLRREEGTWRGVYAGTVGLLEARRQADWALAIRTGFAVGPRLYTAAGAGVVHRSQPSQEFDETIVKLSHIESTLVGGRA
jgi:anthranilate/para-aminobenzoate synthase component I